MEDAPPQLGNIPQYSEMNIPTLGSQSYNTNPRSTANGNASFQDSVKNNAQSAMNTVQNHPLTQNVVDTVSNGDVSPIAETVKDQHAKTSAEFRNLADSRTQPNQRAATGQPLTHYHSLFYNLLSWENPRATAITYSMLVALIFAGRYLPILRWTFKTLYISLGLISATELVGKLTVNQGIVSSFRPKKYFTIPRQSLESMLGDVEQLINFFVIEFQRVMLAENLVKTVAAFTTALFSYWLIMFLPLWGLALTAVTIMFLAPLIYTNNKEVIDQQLQNMSNIVNRQAHQVKGLAEHHTARATETVKAYAGDYSAKAQNYMGSAKKTASAELNNASQSAASGLDNAKQSAASGLNSASQSAASGYDNAKQSAASGYDSAKQSAASGVNKAASASGLNNSTSGSNYPVKSEPAYSPPTYSSSDFPHAPRQEPTPGVMSPEEQYAQSRFGGQAAAAPSQYGDRQGPPMQSY